jgi:hypothetical protein
MDLYTQNEVDLEGLQRLKRPRIALDWNNSGYWDKRRTVLALLLMGILFLGTMVVIGSKFGSEAEQVQAVDKLFTR